MVTRGFTPPPNGTRTPVELDAGQADVVALADDQSAVVLGAPGTGKTTALIETIADRVHRRGWNPSHLTALTTSRTAATSLRDAVGIRLGIATDGPMARSVNSLAFELVAHASREAGAEPPRLLTGGEQDGDIAALLAGHIEDGTGPQWPDPLTAEVRRLRGFRTELRELMMRATEHGIDPERMRRLGARHDHPEWVAAADFIDDYLRVAATARQDQLDSAELVQFAVAALERGEVSERVAGLRLVLVDDLQEATTSTVALLAALARRGVGIIAFGDPDVAANAFRGGEADVVGRLGTLLDLPGMRTLRLPIAHRQSQVLRRFTRSVTERIGTAGAVGHRAAASSVPSRADAIVRLTASTPAREWAVLARYLRERHLIDGVGWDDMAVVVRSGANVPAVARALALAEVPTRTATGTAALRDEHAARELLTIVDIGVGRTELTAETATDLLLGVFGGLDRLMLRKLRLALRTEELAGDGHRSADELLLEALAAPGRFATIDHRVARGADRLATTLDAVRRAADEGASIEELLWLVWQRSAVATTWFEQALGTGITSGEANRNLDAVLALFTAAKRFVEREPDAPPGVFLARVLDAEVPEDTLSPRSVGDAVLVTTPSGTVGQEFEVVAIGGLQDGVWPNLRLRGSLLHPHVLVRVAAGEAGDVIDARKAVLADELRMFALACSRARSQLILTAAVNDDEAASIFFSLLPPETVSADTGAHPLTLRGLTARLRRELTTAGRSTEREAAASALAALAAAGVPGADPSQWHGLLEPSTVEPLYIDEEPVPVSPSRLEAFENSPLDWFIDTVAGSPSNTAMGIGTIVHWAMETATEPHVDAVWHAIEGRWQELLFEAPWLGERQKRAARALAAGVAEYLADFQRDGKILVAAERRFALSIGRAELHGAIDRVERGGAGEVVIVDLKTGAPITKQAAIDEHPQLGAYQLAYAEGQLNELMGDLDHRPGGAKLLYVRKGVRGKLYREGVQAALDDEQLDAFRERIKAAAAEMAQSTYRGSADVDDWSGHGVAQRRLHRVKAVSSD